MRTAVIVGNPKAKSRTLEAGVLVAKKLTGAEPDLTLDLIEMGPALLEFGNAKINEAIEAVRRCNVIICASPTF